jgi:hypothetical protein
MNIEVLKIIHKLIEKNNKKESIWVKIKEGTFRIELGKGYICVNYFAGFPTNKYSIIIYDYRGEEINHYREETEDGIIAKLYDSIMKLYLDESSIYNSMLNELNSNRVIGKDDDIF